LKQLLSGRSLTTEEMPFMESQVKIMGHPVHPMLIVFPLGLLAASLGFDIGYLKTGNPEFAIVSYWMISVGIIGGLLAAIFGAVDWWAIPSNTRAKAIGLWHGIGNVIVVLLFIGSWILRDLVPGYLPADSAVALSAIAVGLALITGWLGGELVGRLGVGVDEGAHVNAPNSLSKQPASAQSGQSELPRPHGV
jgi:uncharacterized membrane protein